MLQVTDAAIGVLKQMRAEAPEVSGEAAVRLQLTTLGDEPGLGFGFSDDPVEGDQQVVESDDIEVFLAPELVEPLDGAVVDTVPTSDGEQLVLKSQEGDAGDSPNDRPTG